VSEELELAEQLAPPMANGEVLFEAPWQGRAFGMARTLAQAGVFSWDEFRVHLIRVIGIWDRNADDANDYEYYQHFLAALEGVLAEKQLLDGEGLSARVAEFQARPHDHDH
jgi:nitrile hydratase accessory protein